MRYILLWAVFVAVFFSALLGIELLEGNKITTTEYYGLRNLGLPYLILFGAYPLLAYPVTFLPLTVLARKFIAFTPLRILLYTGAGGLCGWWLFGRLYGDYFVRQYGLQPLTAVLLLAAAGLLCGLAERYIPAPHIRSG